MSDMQRGFPLQSLVWSAATTGANGQSSALDTGLCPFVSAFGNVSGATTITLMLSRDNVNWYAGPTVVVAGAGNFFLSAEVGAQFVALQSTNSVTATAVVSAK